MMETGRMTRLMAMVAILTPMELSTKGIGKTISNTEKVTNNGLMALNTLAATSLARRTVKVSSFGLTSHPTMVTLWTTTSME